MSDDNNKTRNSTIDEPRKLDEAVLADIGAPAAELEVNVTAEVLPPTLSDRKSDLDAAAQTAKQFVDIVVAGSSPEQAAAQIGADLTTLLREPTVADRISTLMRKYSGTTAKQREELIRLRLMEVLLEGSDKNSMTAAGMLDPSFKQQGSKTPGVAVQVNIGDETRAVLGRLKEKTDANDTK